MKILTVFILLLLGCSMIAAQTKRNTLVNTKNESKPAETVDFNWKVSDLSGKQVSLSQFKGKVIFLTFWATYCGICRGELPSIQSLWKSLGDRDDIAFLLVSKDDESETVKKFLTKNAYDFPAYMRVKGQPSKAFQGGDLPVTYVIDQNGKILLHLTGGSKQEDFSMSKFLLETANKKL